MVVPVAVMTMIELVDLLHARRVGPDRWMARCPTALHRHGDRNPSLSLRLLDGKRLIHCFSGCRIEGIAQALGVTLRELLGGEPAATREPRHRPRTAHDIVLELARGQKWVDALPAYEVADAIRQGECLVEITRRRATAMGDTDAAWDLLALAAELERLTWQLEVDADEELLEAARADRGGCWRSPR
jgi:hypothetical protein